MMPYRIFLARPGIVERTRNFLWDNGCVIDWVSQRHVRGFARKVSVFKLTD